MPIRILRKLSSTLIVLSLQLYPRNIDTFPETFLTFVCGFSEDFYAGWLKFYSLFLEMLQTPQFFALQWRNRLIRLSVGKKRRFFLFAKIQSAFGTITLIKLKISIANLESNFWKGPSQKTRIE